MNGTSSSGSLTVRVDRWTVRIFRASPLNTIPLALGIFLLSWAIGILWWGVALAVVLVAVRMLQNRYVIVEAELGEDLLLKYLGGRERSVDPGSVQLRERSLWRVCFYGGFPLVERSGLRCVGGFYPTLEWDDIDALGRWLDAAQHGGGGR